MLLAIDTSCDETALTVLDIDKVLVDGEVLSEKHILSEIISSQVKLHAPYGGVVPELAAREHFNNLQILFKNILSQAGIKKDDISVVAVTRGPGLNGCLLVGFCFAKAFAAMRKIPLLALNHVEGHIFSAELMGRAIQYPALALVVSGGHTMLVLMKGFRQYEIVAKTRDDAAGEAFDKSANLLGLGYPGGAALAKRAELGNALAYKLPIGLAGVDEAFSFSGLKTAVGRLVGDLKKKRRRFVGAGD
jgi:N6-L-threonylcarbamoyladenine synthase